MFSLLSIFFLLYSISTVQNQIQVDHCGYANPCQNQGTCINNSTSDLKVSCICPTRYNGVFCQNLAECNPCVSEACTFTEIGGYCLCESEYKGIFVKCPVLRGTCDLTPDLCLNGGTCRNSIESNYEFVCDCPAHHTGLRCQTEVLAFDPCEYISCLNGGTCKEHGSGFKCDCTEDFDGVMCEKHIFVVDNLINENQINSENLISDNNNNVVVDGHKFESKIIESIVSKWISMKIVKSFQNFLHEMEIQRN